VQDRIAKGLAAQFEQHRIIVWSDPDAEMRETFDALALPGVIKAAVQNNEFALKHRVLRAEPREKFLIYRTGARPADLDNWLLDIELGHGTFKADQVAMWRTELGLPERFDTLIGQHAEFFRSAKRFEKLKAAIRGDDTETTICLRMLAVCAGGDGGLDTVVEAMLQDLSRGGEDGLRLITRVGLAEFLWKQVGAQYGYRSDTPGVQDFAITLFKSAYRAALGEDAILGPEALVVFRRWQNNRNAAEAFGRLSAQFATELGMEADLHQRDFRKLVEADQFEAIDKALIIALAQEVANRTSSPADVQGWIRQRRQSHWFSEYRDLYEAISHAAAFQQALAQTTLGMTSLAEGVRLYASTWFVVDQLYRKFVFHMRRSGQATLMQPLFQQVENHYVNSYLLRLNESWQKQVDAAAAWHAEGVVSQRDFYDQHVCHFRRKDQRICVVISDALRFEVAEELLTRIRTVDRYEASIAPMLGSLPSYTQLGMASLLPNKVIEIADNDTGTVLVDGENSAGTENRKQILAAGRAGDRTTAMKSEDFMNLNKEEARALLSGHDVLYIYHNKIDVTGDKPVTEDAVCAAAEEAIEEVIRLAKKLTAANASNIIVTADHGFIYQHRPIEESDYSTAEVTGSAILYRDRRFILGHGLQPQHGLRRFTPAEAGLQGGVEMLIPKSITRLRRQGSGSRFVHGGATLQEVVVPVVTISKKRQSDVSQVEVSIAGANRLITSGQLGLLLYQETPVSEKVRARRLRIGIYAEGGQLISDSHTRDFDLRADAAREREVSLRLLLTKGADAFNGKEVVLRFEEQVGDTSHYRTYRETRYTLRRGFAADFDF
jgi:uncharacterized protein (TIGR02687 family)